MVWFSFLQSEHSMGVKNLGPWHFYNNPGQSKADLSNLEWYYNSKVPLLPLTPSLNLDVSLTKLTKKSVNCSA